MRACPFEMSPLLLALSSLAGSGGGSLSPAMRIVLSRRKRCFGRAQTGIGEQRNVRFFLCSNHFCQTSRTIMALGGGLTFYVLPPRVRNPTAACYFGFICAYKLKGFDRSFGFILRLVKWRLSMAQHIVFNE